MPISLFAGCSDGCGWIAAIVSMLAFGSFGVPIKASVKVEVDPLVMQSYKTIVCFCTCWLVLLMGEEVRWTPWGIVSGLFWVPGAACGIYGIRNAGLAIAVGTWSSIIVILSFFWGFIIFKEPIRDLEATACAFFCLICGLVGMSQYSKPASVPTKKVVYEEEEEEAEEFGEQEEGGEAVRKRGGGKEQQQDASSKISQQQKQQPPTNSQAPLKKKMLASPMEIEPLVSSESGDTKDLATKDRVILFGGRLALTRRQLGVIGACINGAWGGTCLIPMHFASEQGFGGAGYLISFASGSLLVNAWIWLVLYFFHVYQTGGNLQEAYDFLPSWHVKELWFPGLLAGFLYSTGNFASILAVTYLGQGVGYSFCQCQILVSGLWGIFYYKEISGRERITKWFLSAVVTVVGILWLSFEHQGSMAH